MDLKEVVNRSGFPLQIAIETMIKKDRTYHEWSVICSEHAWENSKGESGFIDLILEFNETPFVLVIECKRVLDTTWVFLNKEGVNRNQSQAKVWISSYDEEKQCFKFCGWTDVKPKPHTDECEFCVVPGQDPKSAPMLERTAATLVASTEAYAKEEKTLFPVVFNRRVYFNVIVTTAKLNVCTFDPCSISLVDGILKEADFHSVPYLRFRKQLQTAPVEKENSGHKFTYTNFSRERENTVFVVNAASLGQFLNAFEFGKISQDIL